MILNALIHSISAFLETDIVVGPKWWQLPSRTAAEIIMVLASFSALDE